MGGVALRSRGKQGWLGVMGRGPTGHGRKYPALADAT